MTRSSTVTSHGEETTRSSKTDD